ncbi:MAG TPA: hypothetical protein VE782_12800, partial [Myxococcaceae bacterium]|nr:hypothetical protein [Myxococcaceae bacterium]
MLETPELQILFVAFHRFQKSLRLQTIDLFRRTRIGSTRLAGLSRAAIAACVLAPIGFGLTRVRAAPVRRSGIAPVRSPTVLRPTISLASIRRAAVACPSVLPSSVRATAVGRPGISGSSVWHPTISRPAVATASVLSTIPAGARIGPPVGRAAVLARIRSAIGASVRRLLLLR